MISFSLLFRFQNKTIQLIDRQTERLRCRFTSEHMFVWYETKCGHLNGRPLSRTPFETVPVRCHSASKLLFVVKWSISLCRWKIGEKKLIRSWAARLMIKSAEQVDESHTHAHGDHYCVQSDSSRSETNASTFPIVFLLFLLWRERRRHCRLSVSGVIWEILVKRMSTRNNTEHTFGDETRVVRFFSSSYSIPDAKVNVRAEESARCRSPSVRVSHHCFIFCACVS